MTRYNISETALMAKSKAMHATLNKDRSCSLCKEKIKNRPYVQGHKNIMHEACWNKTF
tara:strand:+ start:1082 stop:1255 length:174 start_codon:yes stop_codon:yes gene_type:complete